ncbi:MAG: hypothetical protein L3J67_01205 [Hyphomicrobiaceae bacterium]|nr:hypothetical protein [Hyphomicrobiaceae bacterium]
MNSTARPLFTSLLVLLALLLSLALLAIGYTLLAPRPSQAQSVNLKTAPLKWSGDGLKLELQTMPLDLVRAFFLGRGFSKHDAELIAKEGCIFRSAIGNSGDKVTDPAISIELEKWRVITPNKTSAPRTREDWDVIWEQKKAPEQAKTAFYWALFPTKQTYQASDYNWGMISFALAPQSRFNLEVYWQIAGVPKKHVFKNLECGK